MARAHRGGRPAGAALTWPTARLLVAPGSAPRSSDRDYALPFALILTSVVGRSRRPGRVRVQQVDEGGALGEDPALVEIALVGDLPGVQARRLGQDEQPLDP